jgi:hypothetical protein
MGPANLPPDAAGHFNTALLPNFLMWAGIIIGLVFIAWYLNRDKSGKKK